MLTVKQIIKIGRMMEQTTPPFSEPILPPHDWFEFSGLPCCRVCGIVQRRDGLNAGCRGRVVVVPRDGADIPTAGE